MGVKEGIGRERWMADTPSREIKNMAIFVLVRLWNGSLNLYIHGFSEGHVVSGKLDTPRLQCSAVG